ncbi:MAG TPA: M56 family metallopeptidase [Rhizomicrobium sp.]|jgi:beta-lactamase regulating signal transducer with metallopeptidase domain
MIALLLNHLWQSSLCVGAAGILTFAFRRNGANVRFWLWFASSVKFLVPFAALTALGTCLLTPIFPPVAAPKIILIEPLAKPFSVPAIGLVTKDLDTKPAARSQSQARPTLVKHPVASAIGAAWFDLEAVLLAIWAVGFLTLIARWLIRWARARALLDDAAEVPVEAPIAVKYSESGLEPGLIGILRPVILLPQGIEQQLTPNELRAVLTHELCHWRRRDNLLAAVHMLVETLFWFFPLVWWLGARLNAERERACDEGVLADGNDPQMYAEGILKVCRAYLQSPLACVAGISGASLKNRIELIAENRSVLQLNAVRKFVLGTSAVASLAVPLALGLLTAPVAQLLANAAPVSLLTMNLQKRAAPLPETSSSGRIAPVYGQPEGGGIPDKASRNDILPEEMPNQNRFVADRLHEKLVAPSPDSLQVSSTATLPTPFVIASSNVPGAKPGEGNQHTASPALASNEIPTGVNDPDALTCNAPQLISVAKLVGWKICVQNSMLETLLETGALSRAGTAIKASSDLPMSGAPSGAGDPDAVTCLNRQRQTGSLTYGPIACARNDFWAKLNASGCMLSTDARHIMQSGTTKNLNALACGRIQGRNGILPSMFF